MPPFRMTVTVHLVLAALLAEPCREMYGYEIVRAAGLKSGTLYPVLNRLESEGWLSSRRESVVPQAEGRPPRRYYRLTEAGEVQARAEMARSARRLAALGAALTASAGPAPAEAVPPSHRREGAIVRLSRLGPMEFAPADSGAEPDPDAKPCKHEGLRMAKGVCPDCSTYVTSKP